MTSTEPSKGNEPSKGTEPSKDAHSSKGTEPSNYIITDVKSTWKQYPELLFPVENDDSENNQKVIEKMTLTLIILNKQLKLLLI